MNDSGVRCINGWMKSATISTTCLPFTCLKGQCHLNDVLQRSLHKGSPCQREFILKGLHSNDHRFLMVRIFIRTFSEVSIDGKVTQSQKSPIDEDLFASAQIGDGIAKISDLGYSFL